MVVMAFLAITNLHAQNHVQNIDPEVTVKKLNTLIYLINNFYVDTLNMNDLTETIIVNTLKELDPHSAYISI